MNASYNMIYHHTISRGLLTVPYKSIPDSEVRKKLDEFIDYGKNPRFSKALDEICDNLVGQTGLDRYQKVLFNIINNYWIQYGALR
jgi:hypothetical protein